MQGMPDESLASTLQRLEDELFYAVLDVALDIEGELIVGDSQPLYIPARRLAIRYSILYPVHSAGTMDRYCQLRWKAGLFLKKHSVIKDIEFRSQGIIRWDGLLEVTLPKRNRFSELLTALRAEENRRNPERKMEADVNSATARIVELASSFHRASSTTNMTYRICSPRYSKLGSRMYVGKNGDRAMQEVRQGQIFC
jgi:hypothetical protein